MNANALTKPSTNSPMASLREQSASALKAAIHSPHDPGATLKRVNAVLGLYFDPDNDPETKAAMRQEFVVALAAYPDWAVQRAFDAWVKTGQRRPTPGEVVILVGREMKPMTDELARRDRLSADMRDHQPDLSPEEIEQRRAFAQSVMERTGFAKGMVRRDGPRRETVTDEDIAEMKALLASKPQPKE